MGEALGRLFGMAKKLDPVKATEELANAIFAGAKPPDPTLKKGK